MHDYRTLAPLECCSVHCAGQYKRKYRGEMRTCALDGCEKQWRVTAHNQKNRYCSPTCRNKSRTRTTTQPCAYCGASLTRPEWDSHKSNRWFCNQQHRGLFWKENPELSAFFINGVNMKAGYRYLLIRTLPEDQRRMALACVSHRSTTKGQNDYIQEHRLVMAMHLGRPLLPHPEEQVHHLGAKTDNRIEMLELKCGTEHGRQHWHNERAGRALALLISLAQSDAEAARIARVLGLAV